MVVLARVRYLHVKAHIIALDTVKDDCNYCASFGRQGKVSTYNP